MHCRCNSLEKETKLHFDYDYFMNLFQEGLPALIEADEYLQPFLQLRREASFRVLFALRRQILLELMAL